MFENLTIAIDGLHVPVDGGALAEILVLRDRFEAKLCEAVCAFADTDEWDRVEGCASLAAWLRVMGRMTAGDAARLARTARRLRSLPTLRAAWLDGTISGGHVATVVANLSDRTAPLFDSQEDELVPVLAHVEVGAAAVAMKAWAAEARERLGVDGSEPDPDRSAHLSSTLSGGRLDANLEPEAFHAAETALRLAMGSKVEDDSRTVTQRRHDALAEVFTHYLDHQADHVGGHRRAHVNITVGLDALVSATGQGSFDDATPISAADARRMACDADVHRVITRADGSALDYGRATRTVSAALFMVLCLRDRGCRYPGCDRPAHTTDAHHIRHWIDHGETNEVNLVLLCASTTGSSTDRGGPSSSNPMPPSWSPARTGDDERRVPWTPPPSSQPDPRTPDARPVVRAASARPSGCQARAVELTPEQVVAIRAAHAWFERNSGWAPPDPDTLADWVAEGLARCPDDCVAAHDGWCEHGLASWWLILRDLEADPAGRRILG